MSGIVVKGPCMRCGHGPDAHRFDDYTLREGYNHLSPDAEFRCLGPCLDGCDQECPDFEGVAVQLSGDFA